MLEMNFTYLSYLSSNYFQFTIETVNLSKQKIEKSEIYLVRLNEKEFVLDFYKDSRKPRVISSMRFLLI